jgi:mannose-6-phosphate isomerase-like protein (cupin superfamily)
MHTEHPPRWTVCELIEQSHLHGGGFLQLDFNSGLSMSVITVKRGTPDLQETSKNQSHDADELYVIMRGEGKLRVWGDDYDVAQGSLVVVPASVPHFFHSVVSEELIALAVLGPRNTVESRSPSNVRPAWPMGQASLSTNSIPPLKSQKAMLPSLPVALTTPAARNSFYAYALKGAFWRRAKSC